MSINSSYDIAKQTSLKRDLKSSTSSTFSMYSLKNSSPGKLPLKPLEEPGRATNALLNFSPSLRVLWTIQEKTILRAAVASYGVYSSCHSGTNKVDIVSLPWPSIALHLPGRTPGECLLQWRHIFTKYVLKKAPNGMLYVGSKPALRPYIYSDSRKRKSMRGMEMFFGSCASENSMNSVNNENNDNDFSSSKKRRKLEGQSQRA